MVFFFFFLKTNFKKTSSSKEPVLPLLSGALLLPCISHNSSFYSVDSEAV